MSRIVVNTLQLNALISNLVAVERAHETRGVLTPADRQHVERELKKARAAMREYLKPTPENRAH